MEALDEPHEHEHEHDLGLRHDMQVMARRLLERRRLLGLIASGGAALVLPACGGGGDEDDSAGTTTDTSTGTGSGDTGTGGGSGGTTCMVDPPETEGPYPADGSNSASGSSGRVNALTQSGVVRSDITGSFGGLSGTAAGLPVKLTITLVNVNNSCAPLSGYAIYLWHCDRDGKYSLYDIPGQNYLRGVQATDSNGQCTFTTIFPACYAGRWPHIHFEVYRNLASATTYSNKLQTSQMALPAAVCSAVYNNVSGYGTSVSNLRGVSLSSDNVFGDNTAEEIAWQTPSFTGDTASGYTATISVGLRA